MTQYHKLYYQDVDIICRNPQILLNRFDPKEKYVAVYDGFHYTERGTSVESGVNYAAINFIFTGHNSKDEYSKNLFYVCREDGFGLRKETNCKNDLRHGVQRSYYENGHPWTEENLLDGQYDGLRIFYHKDGQLDKVAMYRDNKQLCLETIKLRWTQKMKKLLGRTEDIEAVNQTHWDKMKKLYPQYIW